MKHVLHIGAHKTATTHLQKALDRASTQLQQAGVVFLGPSLLRKPPFNFLSVLSGDDAAATTGLAQAVAGADRLVLSEENLLGTAHQPKALRQGRFYPNAETRLARLIRAYDLAPLHLMMAVRDPVDFYVSAYSQLLYSGRVRPFEEFIGACDVPSMQWSELIDRLIAVDGVDQFTVWRYEDYPAVGRDILPIMLGATGNEVTLPDHVQHPGLSARAHAQIFEWVAAGQSPPARGFGREARALFPKKEGVAAYQPWDPEAVARSAAAHTVDLDRIAAIDRVNLLRPQAAS